MNLADFLVRAKVATYADKNAKKTTLKDGAKELVFEEGGFKYRDRYYLFNPFSGQEIVWEHEEMVWSMNYYGVITSDVVPEKEVYEFLRKAMSQVTSDRPFRGPDSFISDSFEYRDASEGNISLFSGEEIILFEGKEIYKLFYHGGSMINPIN